MKVAEGYAHQSNDTIIVIGWNKSISVRAEALDSKICYGVEKTQDQSYGTTFIKLYI